MSNAYTESLNKLIDEFGRLPGIGPKSDERLALPIPKAEPAELHEKAQPFSHTHIAGTKSPPAFEESLQPCEQRGVSINP